MAVRCRGALLPGRVAPAIAEGYPVDEVLLRGEDAGSQPGDRRPSGEQALPGHLEPPADPASYVEGARPGDARPARGAVAEGRWLDPEDGILQYGRHRERAVPPVHRSMARGRTRRIATARQLGGAATI